MKKLTLDEKCKLITGGSYWSTYAAEGIRPIRFSDGPSGLRVQTGRGDRLGKREAEKATCFPAHSALAASWNKSLVREVGEGLGKEADYYGVDILLAPDINIKRSPFNGRNFEYFSEDAYLNGKLGGAYSAGVNSGGAGACLKHFAANNREFGRMVYSSQVDERTLRELYLTGFEIAVKEGSPAAVMTAYNRLNGVYCSENKGLLTDILRGEWNFGGLVISDWGGTHMRETGVAAGEDLEMPRCAFSPDEVRSAIESGKLEERALDECVERIISASSKERKNCEKSPFEENTRLSRKCAEECITLLKNDGILPLKQERIAVFGSLAERGIIQGGGSSKVRASKSASAKEVLKPFSAGFERGYKEGGKYSARLVKRAVKLLKRADVALVFLGDPDSENEGADRESLTLPYGQIKLLEELSKTGKKILGVLCCGSAYDTSWDSPLSALLLYGFCGQEGTFALSDILFGKVNPSGKLAESFPKDISNLPVKNFGKDAYAEVYEEGLFSGYRYYVSHPDEVKYPFGFGLSYTKFEYSDFSLSEDGVSFSVKNIGERDGFETCQTYIRFPENARSPKLQLKGFEKVFLKVGESKKIFIPFDEYTFRSFDTSIKKFVTVGGSYEIFVGASSADLRSAGIKELRGVDEISPSETEGAKPYVLERDKKGRVIATAETPFCELKNARGLFGRFFSRIALFIVKRDRVWAGSLEYLPLRSLAQFGQFGRHGLSGLLNLFNGKPFKGIIQIIFGRKK